jgi:hypothetical protein
VVICPEVQARGWHKIGPNPAILGWARAARPVAEQAIAASPEPWRCGGTWFVGVDALPNGPDGAVAGAAFPWDALPLAPCALHWGQLSTIRPGYPQLSAEETPAAFRFRQTRDAAHLDGLLPVGPEKRRKIKEPHAWILGLPLTEAQGAPLVVWERSHLVLQDALRRALAPHPPAIWAEVDITEAYQTARAQVFELCPRIELRAVPGEAMVLHRLTLHGVAPWPSADHDKGQSARIIAYFRPMLTSVADWIRAP